MTSAGDAIVKRSLVLGAGLVARPLVNYLLDHGIGVTVASRTVSKAERLVAGREGGEAIALNVADHDLLESLVGAHDLSVSLLPYAYHVRVAELCLKHGRPLVTTSYVSDEMNALDEEARGKGVLILNEVGLDPGIDHMSAMQIIHRIRDEGASVASFRSYTGGLPAPDSVTTPWGYKFSWSPLGVVMAGLNSATWLEEGEVIEVPGPELFAHNWPMKIGGMELEAYPNRDSLRYIERYGLEGIGTMFRGTLRYPGWSRTMKALVDFGYLDLSERPLGGMTFGDLTAQMARMANGTGLRERVAMQVGLPPDADPLDRMEWLGLFGSDPIPMERGAPLHVLVRRLEEKLQYAPGERDMIVQHHEFEASDGRTIRSTLVDYGDPEGDSSMSRTVSLPAAIGARLILEGGIEASGVRIPVHPDIYEPIMDELANYGVRFEEDQSSTQRG